LPAPAYPPPAAVFRETRIASDAITILKADHPGVRPLVREFRRTGGRAVKTRQKLVKQVIELLTMHTYIESVLA
jgi:hypothetical protein